ncbi:RING finger and transmembrane domain-containing protein 2, partial [Stegodyphus mimosarum]
LQSMAESNRPSRIGRPNIPWSIQQIHQNSHHIASSATQHIHELHDYVIQGLSPLITSAPIRSSRNSPTHSAWFETIDSANPVTRNTDLTDVTSSGNYVIDIESPEVDSYNNANESPSNSLSGAEPADANNRSNESDQGAAALRNTPELQALFAFAGKYVPFLLVLLFKLMYDHRIGILVNIGLFITFFHANTVVKREVSKQGKRRLKSLLLIFVNLVMSILVIYTILADHNLAFALVFVPPYTAPVDIWDVLWIVSITDFVLKLITILLKVIFVALPAKLIAYQKKGKYYLFIERTSQLYRTLAPMQHWLYFFSESYSGPSKVFGVILSAAYLIFKCKSILRKAKLWKKTLIQVIQSKTYGVTPSSVQIKEAGDACPICQDDYKSPSMLQCKHIFCEECVALWFDRERTCPICRAQIADDPTWRDGST